MLPVNPLQPYIREGEGSGEAFIVQRPGQRNSLSILQEGNERRRQERLHERRALQQQLVDLEGITANALPIDQQHVQQRYNNDIVNWVAEERNKGRNPYDPNTDEYFELQRRINGVKSDAIKAKLYKDAVIQAKKDYDPAKHEEGSISNIIKYGTETPFDKKNYEDIPQLQTIFNPADYLQNYTQRFKPASSESYENIKPTTAEGGHVLRGQYTGEKVTKFDYGKTLEGIASDNSYEGRRYKEFALNQFNALPDEKKQEIYNNIIKKNATAAEATETGHKLLEAGVVAEMANSPVSQMFGPKREVVNLTEQQLPKSDSDNKSPDQIWTKTTINVPGGGRETFNKKYKTNYTEAQWKGMSNVGSGAPYVALEPKKKGTADTESLQLDVDGKPFKPQGYLVDGSKVYAKGAINDRIQKQNPDGTLDTDAQGDPKFTDQYVPKAGLLLSDKNLANVASHYGFSNVVKFKAWLNDYTENQQGAVDAFAAQFGRNPTKTELDKLLAKYK